MNQIVINREDLKEYILPDLEHIRALLIALNFKKSLRALLFLQFILEYEMEEFLRDH